MGKIKRRTGLPQSIQLLHGESGLVKNGAESSEPKRFVIWNADTGERGFAAKDDVTATLTLDCKTKSN
jgi:hypothetical protein